MSAPAVPAYALALSHAELLEEFGRKHRDLTNSQEACARLQARLDQADQSIEAMHAIMAGRFR
jgi:hypothetical protein